VPWCLLVVAGGKMSSFILSRQLLRSSTSSIVTHSTFIPSPFSSFQIASFSKYISRSRAKHLPLNTKRAGKGYKKGYGARTEGIVTSKAKFIPVAAMRTELVVPDLSDFKVPPQLL
jgi:hypothetical protein